MGSPCRVRQVDALYEHGKAVTDFVLRARVPLFVLLLIAWLRDAPCEVHVTPVIGGSYCEAIAFVEQDDVAGVAQTGQSELRLI